MATVTTSEVRGANFAEATRRTLDILLAAVALIALLPLMSLIALAIVLESGRPIFFSHTRLGLGGRPFRMYKFRKFHKDCSSNGLQLTLDDDARMTKIGRLLRATKLDELPQFWNVLIGDMSMIGPRPESTGYADCFKDGFEDVLKYKPGILGPTQVKFRDEAAYFPAVGDVDEFYRKVLFPIKARMDLDYYSGRSLLGDLGWLVQGILATIGVHKPAAPDTHQSGPNFGHDPIERGECQMPKERFSDEQKDALRDMDSELIEKSRASANLPLSGNSPCNARKITSTCVKFKSNRFFS